MGLTARSSMRMGSSGAIGMVANLRGDSGTGAAEEILI
jgi:hypothetical protein